MNRYPDSLISSLVKQVKKECLLRRLIIPTDRFVLKLLRLLLLNPTIARGKTSTDLPSESIIELMMNIFKIPDNPSVTTLDLQNYFCEAYQDRRVFVENQYHDQEIHTAPLLELISGKQNVKGKLEADKLYHHISCYVILMSGITNPATEEKLKEITNIVKSVLTSKELARFVTKTTLMKKHQLQDVCKIATGVKIFNEDCEKKIDESSEELLINGNAIRRCNNFLCKKMAEVEEYISSLMQHYLKFYFQEEFRERTSFTNIGNSYYLKGQLILLQQIKLYLKKLYEDSSSLFQDYQFSLVHLRKILTKIRRIVKSRSAIPVIEIYPQFRELSSSWMKLQDFMIVSNHLMNIASQLNKYFDKVVESKYLDYGINSVAIKYEENKTDSRNLFLDQNPICKYISPEKGNLYEVQYNGFCPVAFVEQQGFLISGIKEHGLIEYQNAFFSFSSMGALQKFILRPEMLEFVKKLAEIIFQWPEVIELMNMEKVLERFRTKSSSLHYKEIQVRDVEVQTEIHPIPSTIYRNYESSVWKIKI